MATISLEYQTENVVDSTIKFIRTFNTMRNSIRNLDHAIELIDKLDIQFYHIIRNEVCLIIKKTLFDSTPEMKTSVDDETYKKLNTIMNSKLFDIFNRLDLSNVASVFKGGDKTRLNWVEEYASKIKLS